MPCMCVIRQFGMRLRCRHSQGGCVLQAQTVDCWLNHMGAECIENECTASKGNKSIRKQTNNTYASENVITWKRGRFPLKIGLFCSNNEKKNSNEKKIVTQERTTSVEFYAKIKISSIFAKLQLWMAPLLAT